MLAALVAYRVWSGLIIKFIHCHGIISDVVSGELNVTTLPQGPNNQANWTQHVPHVVLDNNDNFTVEYFVITRSFPGLGKRVYMGNLKSLQHAGFEPRNPTRILVHGWMGNRTSLINEIVPTSYHRIGEYNVIVVDWSKVALNINYVAVRLSIRKVARTVAQFLDFLCLKSGVDPKSVYLIGHSLGAHLCGIVGRLVKSGSIGVIVGLDPAGPLFTVNDKYLLSASDAHYVQTIHSSDVLGFFEPIGHASFYLNGGRRQPGCGLGLDYRCSHRVVVDIFSESIGGENTTFPSSKCSGLRDVDNKKCLNGRTVAYMGGEPIDTSSRGVYYVKTNLDKPFGVTKNLPKLENTHAG